MNRERIEYCIRLMKRAKNLSMPNWRGDCSAYTPNITQLHRCGNTACFAGYVGLSPLFRKDGGRATSWGEPVITRRDDGEEVYGDEAIAAWLDISLDLASKLVYGSGGFYDPIPWDDVKPKLVIAKLEAILRGELQ